VYNDESVWMVIWLFTDTKQLSIWNSQLAEYSVQNKLH